MNQLTRATILGISMGHPGSSTIRSVMVLFFLVSSVLLLLTGCGGGGGGGEEKSGGDEEPPVIGTIPTYDVVYVRYPNETEEDEFVDIPQGEKPYDIAPGADLMLLHGTESGKAGEQVVLVDCDLCSVMDPFISLDGNSVYYSKIDIPDLTGLSSEVALRTKRAAESYIYKIALDDPTYTPIQLTFNDGFDSAYYANNTTLEHDQSSHRHIRDMAPAPLADGRIVFTSNRAALTSFSPESDAVVRGSIQQLYVVDDHDGTANTAELSNLHRLETGNLHMVQHPFQLKDGRIIFSTWQDVATRFRYAMTSLFTVHPDGSNLKQFSEPHEAKKILDHFATQLVNEDVITGYYYPSFDYGYGLLLRLPIDPPGIDYLRGSIDQRFPYNGFKVSFREFDIKGTETITPHTSGADRPAPDLSGKYSMPSAAIDDQLLVAYSSGSVNHFPPACNPDKCEPLRSGIYMIPGAQTASVTSPHEEDGELVKIIDDPNYNEIWPRAVVSYNDIFGQPTPDVLPNISKAAPGDDRLMEGEAVALIGTSSMFNRDPLDETGEHDPFQPSASRESNDGNWRIQGATAGVVGDADIYGVRIIATPPKPFTKPISKVTHAADWSAISEYLNSTRLEQVVARYGSLHGERWEILGEFPLAHTGTTDLQGNPDSSWLAKIPAETPFLIQTLDANGMTVVSELTWRALKSSEKRVDCGGCHAHSVESLDYSTTESGKRSPITGIAGLADSDPIIQNGMWDLTQGDIPLFGASGVEKQPGYSYGVEFTRDVLPIINSRCISCHTDGGSGSMLILDGTGTAGDAYTELTQDPDNEYNIPQISKYIRIPQARQSLLVWVAWGARLDGRLDSDRDNDLDYPVAHPVITGLLDSEKRTIARWVDLGGAIDFPTLSDSSLAGFRYTDDYQLPVINVYQPKRGGDNIGSAVVGFADAKSGIDWSTLIVTYYPVDGSDIERSITVSATPIKNILTFSLPSLTTDKEYVLKVRIEDNDGNMNIETVRFNG